MDQSNERTYPIRHVKAQMNGLAPQIVVLYELPGGEVGIENLYRHEDGWANIPHDMGDWQKVAVHFSDQPSQITMYDRFIPRRFLEPARTVTITKEITISH